MSLVVLDTDDPFAPYAKAHAEKKNEKITGGRYRLPNRDGTHAKGGWQRVTNLVSAFSDQFGLRMWEIEQVMRALAFDHAFYDLLIDTLERCEGLSKVDKRVKIEGFVEKCKTVSGGDAGSKFGNARHAAVEADASDSLPLGATDAYARRHIRLFQLALVRHKLARVPGMQERHLLIERLGAIGTADDILEDTTTSLRRIGDLKTQKKFWTWLEIAAQFACYANADAMWESAGDEDNPRAGRWVDMPKIEKDLAYILWMPREPMTPDPSWEPYVDVYEVDIVRGWEIAQLAHKVVQARSEARRKGNPMAWLRDAPPITETERYAARFAAIDTLAEGSALVREAIAAKVWSPVLATEAQAARDRIKKLAESR